LSLCSNCVTLGGSVPRRITPFPSAVASKPPRIGIPPSTTTGHSISIAALAVCDEVRASWKIAAPSVLQSVFLAASKAVWPKVSKSAIQIREIDASTRTSARSADRERPITVTAMARVGRQNFSLFPGNCDPGLAGQVRSELLNGVQPEHYNFLIRSSVKPVHVRMVWVRASWRGNLAEGGPSALDN